MDFRKSVDAPKYSMAPCEGAIHCAEELAMKLWFRLLATALCGAPLAAAVPGSAQAQGAPAAETKIVFSLDFIPLGRHAPWYAALAEGYYKDEGLDVSIIPAQGTAQVIQAVESGTANIGFVDVPSVIIARGNGSKIKVV